MKFLRWSLRTQVIVMLLIAQSALVWNWRRQWDYAGELLPPAYAELQKREKSSPDATRVVETLGNEVAIYSAEPKSARTKLHRVSASSGRFVNAGFMDNDTILVTVDFGRDYESMNVLFKRRFPEWWWGHFYRPEVWLLPLMLGLLVWSIRKDRAVRA